MIKPKNPTLKDMERADHLLKYERGFKLARDRTKVIKEMFKPYPIDAFLRRQAKKRRRGKRKKR